jgi:hypothetical protein
MSFGFPPDRRIHPTTTADTTTAAARRTIVWANDNSLTRLAARRTRTPGLRPSPRACRPPMTGSVARIFPGDAPGPVRLPRARRPVHRRSRAALADQKWHAPLALEVTIRARSTRHIGPTPPSRTTERSPPHGGGSCRRPRWLIATATPSP